MVNLMDSTIGKYEKLRRIVRETGSVLVAFSGGVDSTLLLKVAHDELGRHAAAITIDAPFHSRHEIAEAARLAKLIGARHILLDVHELEIKGISSNPPNRCYLCKTAVFSICLDKMREHGFAILADGSNTDDLNEYRPGRRALEELGVRSPLQEAGLDKAGIRELSRRLGLETSDKAALTCLLTRFPHGAEITPERIAMVEQCENLLRAKGFGLFRVRAHGGTARIELTEEEMPRMLDPALRVEVTTGFRQSGFQFVTLDLTGYRCGSMDQLQ